MIYLRGEGERCRNGINIFREFNRSIGFILRIGRFGWYVRWSRVRHCLFHEFDLNAFPDDSIAEELAREELKRMLADSQALQSEPKFLK